jgi:hypothetical protein
MSKYLLLIFSVVLFTGGAACGGSSSGSSGKLIEGILTEGAGTDHSSRIKHAAGEFIEEVTICALGRCSRTDGRGQWGFFIDEDEFSNEVLFSIDGHGIHTNVLVNFPYDTNEAFIHFEHNHGVVIVHHMDINGVRVNGHHSHGHDHGHSHGGHN